MFKNSWAWIVALVVALAGCGDVNTKVQVTGGSITGIVEGKAIIYKGIPYAAPPIGDLRWQPPQPVRPWQNIQAATDFGPDCMQLPFPSDAAPLGVEPAEDCLYANVWRPKKAPKEGAYPVIVWIYGGGFVNGGSSPDVYNGAQFAKYGAVFVSFNYRVGRFGFFAHPALTAEANAKGDNAKLGNYAFMDQIAALNWVKDNIAQFAGDPNNVTIVGESAGAVSVQALLQAQQAQGLYHRAAIMSGGGRGLLAAMPLSSDTNLSAEAVGVNFAKSQQITNPDSAESQTLAALRALPAEAVVDGLNLAAMSPKFEGIPTYSGPIMDGSIMTDNLEAQFAQQRIAKVPVMVGATSQDIGFSFFPSKEALFASFGELADEAKATYDPNGENALAAVGYQVGQDRMMQEPARFIANQVTAMGQDAFYYRFDYVAQYIRDGQGAQHASDIPYFFSTVAEKYGPTMTDQDKQAGKIMHRYLMNFAQFGDPNGPGLPNWLPYDTNKHNMLLLNMDGVAQHGPDPWTPRLDLVEKALELSRQ